MPIDDILLSEENASHAIPSRVSTNPIKYLQHPNAFRVIPAHSPGDPALQPLRRDLTPQVASAYDLPVTATTADMAPGLKAVSRKNFRTFDKANFRLFRI